MRCGIIYFSTTGNTEYIAKLYRKEMQKKNIECDMYEVTKTKIIDRNYDMYIIGGPIHCEKIPDYLSNFVLNNIKKFKGKKALVFSTQQADNAPGSRILSKSMRENGFNVIVESYFSMPNNYYFIAFGETSEKRRQEFIKCAEEKVKFTVDCLINGKRYVDKISAIREYIALSIYPIFKMYAKKWAKRMLKADEDICIRCKKCVRECPTQNIKLLDKIEFDNKCINCMKCIHNCPVNAFKYRGKHIKQYERIL